MMETRVYAIQKIIMNPLIKTQPSPLPLSRRRGVFKPFSLREKGGMTTAWMQEVEQRRERLPRAKRCGSQNDRGLTK